MGMEQWGNPDVPSLKLFVAAAACSMLIVAVGYAATFWSVYSELETAAVAIVNRAAKQDRLEITRPVALVLEQVTSRATERVPQ